MNKPLALQQFIPEQTIQSYLDALLQDAAVELAMAEAEIAAPVEAKVVPPVVKAPPPLPAPVIRKETPVVAEPEAEAEAPPVTTQPEAAWREQPFEALLFDVGGLTLAVPLISLGTIHTLESEITPLFGQPDWFLGILPSQTGNLKVLETARWVMPERYTDELKNNLKFVISVQGYDWGMAVHGVSRSIKLSPDQVKWRSQQGKRPWLAGTVIDHMCALLDVSALAALLVSGAAANSAGKTGAAHAAGKPVAKARRGH
ncbi:MAG TPA: chemotaxis protein CheW [Pseudomonas xinjiangensis]|uniref:Chemotaxis protein CheW n=2 Tax=root TaxID=1 RepID=A0A7V1FQE5_9GAMM|nr:chemotaxis protein CheW [Halopseudomonas xinjiangensis]HEC47521.1 chemotaxis protein CheW [Halopseudomonas xinjiangensis]